jgi:hypothetical protein
MSQFGMQMPGGRKRSNSPDVYTGLAVIATVFLAAASPGPREHPTPGPRRRPRDPRRLNRRRGHQRRPKVCTRDTNLVAAHLNPTAFAANVLAPSERLRPFGEGCLGR